MKLTLQIKLLSCEGQAKSLLATLKEANGVCNEISNVVWNSRVFNQFKVHRLVYHGLRKSTGLSAQVIVRCISKVVDAYKLDRGRKRSFRALGAITYDPRIISYKGMTVSMWTVDGRLRIPFVCHNQKYLPYMKGEADLVVKKGKFYVFQTVEVPDEAVKDVEEFIGVDFGISEIATLSDGTAYGSELLNRARDKRFKVRRSVQGKGTRGAERLLKRLGGRERRFATITNHTIAKSVVGKAVSEGKGIAIEDLAGIRKRAAVRKGQRRRQHSWAFSQLRSFIEYKALMAGIPVVVVEPRYTSRTCNICKHIGDRIRKLFTCTSCGHVADADVNASRNIAQLALPVNQSGESLMVSRIDHGFSTPCALGAG